ncbi:hypothetical protein BHE74_00032040 [Ensete ventricosum]|nr:hypothetical protein GW17_00009312 [Ensete ventricosum]RWW60926.1 hypothetical protein BHE74_00032040 [Ensete ventricosum]
MLGTTRYLSVPCVGMLGIVRYSSVHIVPAVDQYSIMFTIPGGRHAAHHASLLQKAGAARVLRAAAAAATAPIEAKICARIVLRNLEHHQLEAST